MKMTGALVVEVLLAGAMSFIWILLLVIRIIEPSAGHPSFPGLHYLLSGRF
jgi:hypothetical protein